MPIFNCWHTIFPYPLIVHVHCPPSPMIFSGESTQLEQHLASTSGTAAAAQPFCPGAGAALVLVLGLLL